MIRLKKPEPVVLSLVVNILYGLYNGILGVFNHSWWFVSLCAYYILLSVMRFAVLMASKKQTEENASPEFVMHFIGYMFIVLSVVLAGMTYLSYKSDRGTKYHQIVMITIALYSFTKLTYAIVKLIKNIGHTTPYKKTLLYISFADALVSIYSLQMSMLVSFEGMSKSDIVLMNSLTGSGVYVFIFILGINLIGGKRVNGKIKNS